MAWRMTEPNEIAYARVTYITESGDVRHNCFLSALR
jgi:hypothetical protein